MEAALEKALANPGMGLLLLDDTNRGLAEDVEQLRQEVSRASDGWKLENEAQKRNSEYVSDMTQMLENIQELVLVHRQDIETEIKQEKSASNEAEGIVRQCRKKHNDLANIQEASELLETHVTQRQRELDDLQKNLTGDSSLLKELLDHLAEADHDNLLLLQYSAEDASRIKELSVALERASGKVATAETELSSSQAEAAAAQTALDQLGTAFLQAAAHRDHLLIQWEITLNHIYQKANDHTSCIEDSLATERKIGILKGEVDQENQILKQVQKSGQEVVENIRVVGEEDAWIKEQHQNVSSAREQIESQLWALQNALSKVNKEIESLSLKSAEQRAFREEKEAFLASIEQNCKKSEEKLAVNTELILSTEESLHSLEAMMKEAESLVKGLIKQKERVMEAELHHKKAVAMWQEQESLIKGEITAMLSSKTRNLTYIKELDARAVKQKEVLHNQELNIQQLRRQIHELTHDGNNNAVDADQQKQLELLNQRLQEVSTTIKILAKQLVILKNTRASEQRNVSQLEKYAQKMEADVTTVKMSNTSAERERARLANSCEELMVDVSLTQLHLQQQMQRLQAVVNNTSQLSQDKTDVEKLVSDQISCVKIRIREADVTLRSLNSEMHQLSLQLHEVSTRVLQLKDKHRKMKCSIATPEGKDVSTAQVFLKVAHERAGLQETGDLLDLEVRRAEEEVGALQQMVALISIEGQQYRSQLHDILYHSEEQKERVVLEEKLATLEEEIIVWQTLLEQAQTDLQGTQSRLHEVELQVHAVEELLREKNIHMTAVQREIESQHTKSRQASVAVSNIQWRTRGKSVQQIDIELRLAQERLRMINSLLGDAVSFHPEASEAVVIYCQQVNIPPPDVTKLTKKESFGSRSSIGTLQSSRSSSASRPRSTSPGVTSWKSASHHSSMSSLHSEDSGHSGSPHLASVRTRRSSSEIRSAGLKRTAKPRITVLNPAFPVKELRRHQLQGRKLLKRPTVHL